MKTPGALDADVVIVGAGFAGCCAAQTLSQQDINVLLIDRAELYPPAFRAEKIEPNQAKMLRKFRLLDQRIPLAGPIGKTVNYREGRAESFDTQEQYGMDYTATVNHFREFLNDRCPIVVDSVTELACTDDTQTVRTKSGKSYRGRLAVIACGGTDKLLKPLGIRRRYRNSLTKWISYRDNHRGFLGRQASRIELHASNVLSLW